MKPGCRVLKVEKCFILEGLDIQQLVVAILFQGAEYHVLRIQGYAYGSKGLSEGMTDEPDDCTFTKVNVETTFGNEVITKCRVPIMTGARKFNLSEIERSDLIAANRKTAELTGIQFMTDALNEEAINILKA